MKTFCFDIDGTLFEIVPGPPYPKGQPIPGAIEYMNSLYEAGHTIYLHTGRHMLNHEVTTQQLEECGAKYHGIFYGKPVADFYIDDKAVAFNGDTNQLKETIHAQMCN